MQTLRLTVEPVPPPDDAMGEFEVQVHLGDEEITSTSAGLGMDPWDLLIPENNLVAGPQPRRITIARCSCGDIGCGSSDITITRDGDAVHWTWANQAPPTHLATFDASAYDAEIARAAADFSWETPARTAGRLVRIRHDAGALQAHGLRLTGTADLHNDPELFVVGLRDENHQIFLDVAWDGRSPQDLADDVCDLLARGPDAWKATWSSMLTGRTEPPAYARPSWRPYR